MSDEEIEEWARKEVYGDVVDTESSLMKIRYNALIESATWYKQAIRNKQQLQ